MKKEEFTEGWPTEKAWYWVRFKSELGDHLIRPAVLRVDEFIDVFWAVEFKTVYKDFTILRGEPVTFRKMEEQPPFYCDLDYCPYGSDNCDYEVQCAACAEGDDSQ